MDMMDTIILEDNPFMDEQPEGVQSGWYTKQGAYRTASEIIAWKRDCRLAVPFLLGGIENVGQQGPCGVGRHLP